MDPIPLYFFVGCSGLFLIICICASFRTPRLRRYRNQEIPETSEPKRTIFIPTRAGPLDFLSFNNRGVSITPTESSLIYIKALTPLSTDQSITSSTGSYFIARL
jgi:hypothetical protein